MVKPTDATQKVTDREEAEYRQWMERISPRWRKRLKLPLDEPLLSVDSLLKILDDRSGKLWQAQEAAAWFLSRRELTEEERGQVTDTLIRLMAAPGYKCLNRADFYAVLAWGATVLLVWEYLCISRYVRDPWSVGQEALFEGGILGLVSAYLARAWTKEVNLSCFQQVRNAVAEALGKMKACEGIAYMLYALYLGIVGADNVIPSRWNLQLRNIAAEALPGMLATLTPAHYGAIPATVVPHLCRTLGHSEETLVLSALDALEKVGDGQAAASVERCAHRDNRQKVRQEAQRILPILQERQRNEQAPHILLRPSSAIEAPADQLLRAVSGISETAPEQLLRPGDAPAEP